MKKLQKSQLLFKVIDSKELKTNYFYMPLDYIEISYGLGQNLNKGGLCLKEDIEQAIIQVLKKYEYLQENPALIERIYNAHKESKNDD